MWEDYGLYRAINLNLTSNTNPSFLFLFVLYDCLDEVDKIDRDSIADTYTRETENCGGAVVQID